MPIPRLGAIVGLPIEAAILRFRGHGAFAAPDWVAVARADAGRAEFLSNELVGRGADALLSFGIAGGTDPALRPGAIVVATEVVRFDGTRAPTDASWRQAGLSRLPGLDLHQAAIGGRDRMGGPAGGKQERGA